MSTLPLDLHTVAHVRAFDRHAMEQGGVPGYTLMNRAGAAALATLMRVWPLARHIVVLCGGGNNGGDGYVLARLAKAAQLEVEVATFSDPARLKGDARLAHDDCVAAGVGVRAFNPKQLISADILVDAIFGIGLDRPLISPIAEQIDKINAADRPILALDVPSGLQADTGAVLGIAIKATHTITFMALKMGFFVGEGREHAGQLHFDDLGEGASAYHIEPAARRLDVSVLSRCLPPRRRDGHKGNYGRILVIGGGPAMPGAVLLCAEACLRAGAGLVTVATHKQNVAAIVTGRPELICHGVEHAAELNALLRAADVVAVGPGLGTDDWARKLFERAVTTDKPVVIDADGLNLLAMGSGTAASGSSTRVLTPHPGEAARLLGTDTFDIQHDRLGNLEKLRVRYGGIVVLKGANTLIGAQEHVPELCDRGNPGMATAGMGDVLTGVIAALLAQVNDPWDAVRAAVLAHALAGDEVAKAQGERGLIASDVIAQLPKCLNPQSN